MLKKLLKLLLLLLLLLLSIVLFNTFTYKSKQLDVQLLPEEAVSDEAVQHLSEAVQIKTVSYDDASRFDSASFTKFLSYLSETYPLCDSLLEKTLVNGFSLLYKWTGSDPSLSPVILLGHMDVVPAGDDPNEKWTHPPFSGKIENGFVWGRGSLDDKVNVIGILETAEQFLKEGKKPKRTVYFAFGHDEEIGGRAGAVKIAELLESQKVKAEFLLDEGLLITRGIVPGIQRPVALIGITEKGYLSLELSIEMEGGHSSMPPKETPVGILSAAVSKLEKDPFNPRISAPVQEFLAHVGPEMPFFSKMAFANQWLFSGVIIGKYQKTEAGSAIVQTTTAPTIFKSGVKDNVLPMRASAVVNFRILPGESISSVTEHVKKAIGDERVKISVYGHSNEPSPVSDVNSPGFIAIRKSVGEVFDSTITAPSLVVGATDARHYTKVTSNAFRFVPVIALPEDLKRLHGTNERISIENFKDCIRFYRRLLINCGEK